VVASRSARIFKRGRAGGSLKQHSTMAFPSAQGGQGFIACVLPPFSALTSN